MRPASGSAGLDRELAIAEAAAAGLPVRRVAIVRRGGGRTALRIDRIAVEEPLEIRLEGEPVAVTMRTPAPGEDIELALGFLLSERIVDPAAIAGAAECRPGGGGGAVDVRLRPGAEPRGGWQRSFYATSSCGICGKAALEAVRVEADPLPPGPRVAAAALGALPARLRAAQRVFDRTGGLHAAGLFTPGGELIAIREDVGRHNALDKLIGWAAVQGLLPLHGRVLQLSGRASFELVQKALVAGIPVVAAVSAPSSLAVDLARESGMTLAGFARGDAFNIYAGEGRIA